MHFVLMYLGKINNHFYPIKIFRYWAKARWEVAFIAPPLRAGQFRIECSGL
jgi:hypothetical protein